MRLVCLRLALALMPARVAHHAGAAGVVWHAVVVLAMQVTVDPQVGVFQQVVIGIAKARGAGLPTVAGVGAAQARCKVGNDDGLVPLAAGTSQLLLKPRATLQRFVSHGGGVERRAVAAIWLPLPKST